MFNIGDTIEITNSCDLNKYIADVGKRGTIVKRHARRKDWWWVQFEQARQIVEEDQMERIGGLSKQDYEFIYGL